MWLHPDPEELARFDLEPGLLPNLAPETRQRLLPFVEKSAWQPPAASPRIECPPTEQYLAVTLDQCMHTGNRVSPELVLELASHTARHLR